MWVLLVYGLLGVLLIGGGMVFYIFAVASRRAYSCPQCGEHYTSEYLDARRCGHCGAELRREA